jgi:hypothetical protein
VDSIGYNRYAIGKDAANQLNNGKSQVQKKRHADIPLTAVGMVVFMIVVMVMAVVMRHVIRPFTILSDIIP